MNIKSVSFSKYGTLVITNSGEKVCIERNPFIKDSKGIPVNVLLLPFKGKILKEYLGVR